MTADAEMLALEQVQKLIPNITVLGLVLGFDSYDEKYYTQLKDEFNFTLSHITQIRG